jgi:hypothetical protein
MALRHRLSIELILVDWATDTRGGRLPLAHVFADRDGGAIHMCRDTSLDPPPDIVLRIIAVPASFAQSLPNPFNLTMLEHHAKNVGLRRARGRWYPPLLIFSQPLTPFHFPRRLLINNPDTLPSPDIVPFIIKANKLWPGSSAAFYRAHRMSLALAPTIALAPSLPADVRVMRLERMLEMSVVSNSASLGVDNEELGWKGEVFDTDALGWDYPIILGDDTCFDGPPELGESLPIGANGTLGDALRRLGPSRQLCAPSYLSTEYRSHFPCSYSMASGDFVMMSRQAMRAVGGYAALFLQCIFVTS